MVNYEKMHNLLIQKGMHPRIIKLFLKKFRIEEEIYKGDEVLREWAMTKGFFPSRVDLYGLNDDNYKNFMPDYVDFMLHPYNNHFVIWINDKLSLKYSLGREFADIMPEYYLYVENNGEYTYLQDTPDEIEKNEEFILNLLKNKKTLIIKPNSSTSGGEGVMKVEWSYDGIRINNKETVTIPAFLERIKNIGNNIVTEYVHQHSELKKIWPDSECTLRIIMVKLPKENVYQKSKWKCIVSYARFGTSISGGTSNVSQGGIGIGFDFKTGRYNPFGVRYRQYCPDGEWRFYEHPDTHVIWQNETLPNWSYVRDTIYKVCNHYGSLSHLGFDVIITEKGFVFCEINSKPALNYEQVICAPILTSDENIAYFKSKGMDAIDRSELYTIYKESKE